MTIIGAFINGNFWEIPRPTLFPPFHWSVSSLHRVTMSIHVHNFAFCIQTKQCSPELVDVNLQPALRLMHPMRQIVDCCARAQGKFITYAVVISSDFIAIIKVVGEIDGSMEFLGNTATFFVICNSQEGVVFS